MNKRINDFDYLQLYVQIYSGYVAGKRVQDHKLLETTDMSIKEILDHLGWEIMKPVYGEKDTVPEIETTSKDKDFYREIERHLQHSIGPEKMQEFMKGEPSEKPKSQVPKKSKESDKNSKKKP